MEGLLQWCQGVVVLIPARSTPKNSVTRCSHFYGVAVVVATGMATRIVPRRQARRQFAHRGVRPQPRPPPAAQLFGAAARVGFGCGHLDWRLCVCVCVARPMSL